MKLAWLAILIAAISTPPVAPAEGSFPIGDLTPDANGLTLRPSMDYAGTTVAAMTISSLSNGSTCDCSQVISLNVSTKAIQGVSRTFNEWGSGSSIRPQVDASGSRIAFTSEAKNLNPRDFEAPGVLVWLAGGLIAANRADTGESPRYEQDSEDRTYGSHCAIWCGPSSISANGRFVAFDSWSSNLAPSDANRFPDVFARDLSANVTHSVSVSRNGSMGNGPSYAESLGGYISGDGRYVVFTSAATDLVDTQPAFCPEATDTWPRGQHACPQVYLRDLERNKTLLISGDQDGNPGQGLSSQAVISADGRYVAYTTEARHLVGTNGVPQVALTRIDTGETQVISRDGSGQLANGRSSWVSISADGAAVAFLSTATNLGDNPLEGTQQVFLYRSDGVRQVSKNWKGDQVAASVHSLSLAGNGKFVAFAAPAIGWVPGENATEVYHIYMVDVGNLPGMTGRSSPPLQMAHLAVALLALGFARRRAAWNAAVQKNEA